MTSLSLQIFGALSRRRLFQTFSTLIAACSLTLGCHHRTTVSTEQTSRKAELCRDYREKAAIAAEARELPLPPSLNCLPVDDAGYASYLEEAEGHLKRELFFAEQIYKAVGFIPEDFPYEECLLKGARSSVNAFYSPEKQAAIIPTTKIIQPRTLVHESVHALQDAAFDLLRLKARHENTTDNKLAFAAVVESDALLTDEETEDKVPSFKAPESRPERDSCELPETLLYQYEFPYTFGLRWLKRAVSEHGKDFRNSVFLAPPHTTTEILYQFGKQHDRSLLEKDLPPTPSSYTNKHWRTLHKDSLGEYTIRTMLRPSVGSKRAVLAGMGWQHDSLRLLYSAEKRKAAISWTLYWATEADAEEFLQNYRQLLLAREGFKLSSEDSAFRGNDGRRNYHLRQWNSAVVLDIIWDASPVLSWRFNDIERQDEAASTK